MTDVINLQNEMQISIHNLEQFKVRPAPFHAAFVYKNLLILRPNEILKVSKQDEGNKIKFETYDNLCVGLAIWNSQVPFNKDKQTGKFSHEHALLFEHGTKGSYYIRSI